MTTTANTFRAAVVAPLGEKPIQFGYWCPWCETTHAHGLAGETPAEARGKTTGRGAHCYGGYSPLAGKGVELTIDRIVRSWEHLEPPGPYLALSNDPLKTRVRLRDVLSNGRLGLALLRQVFGKNRSASGFDARLVDGWAQVFAAGGRWAIQNHKREDLTEGRGVGRLLARLFGVPVGVVAVRTLEDALGLDLPSDYRLALAAMIDRAEVGFPLIETLGEEAAE